MTSKTFIHPTAIIEDGAVIGEGSYIGPYCTLGAQVKLGENCMLKSHVAIEGDTEIGEETEIYPFASIGQAPQDLKYNGENTKLRIGKNNKIREYVTMQLGTVQDEGITKVGDNNLFMALTHIAHDCVVGNNCVLANGATIAGHVHIDDYVTIGGLSAVQQFLRIGRQAMLGGGSIVVQDVIPFGLVQGNRAHLESLNLIGLKRRGFEKDDINALRRAYRMMFAQEGTMEERLDDVCELFKNVELVHEVADFIRLSKKGVCSPTGAGHDAA